MYFSNWTHVSGESHLPEHMRTYATYTKRGIIKSFNPDFSINPWYQPGKAKIFSPCGVLGGNPLGCGGADDCPGGGYPYGKDARDIVFQNVTETSWRKGEIVEVGWGSTRTT